MKTFKVKQDEAGVQAGSIVYDFTGCDFGCASEDTRNFGGGFDEYTSVTHDPNGGAPSFTMRKRNLETISDK